MGICDGILLWSIPWHWMFIPPYLKPNRPNFSLSGKIMHMTMDEQVLNSTHPTLCPPTGNMYIHAHLLIDSLLFLLSNAAGMTPHAMLGANQTARHYLKHMYILSETKIRIWGGRRGGILLSISRRKKYISKWTDWSIEKTVASH